MRRPEDVIVDKRRPYTGAEYRESLRDGREVYIDGERVADVTVHPAFRNSVRSIARLYDALHDPARNDVLTCPTDTGSGGYTHRYFRVSRSREELVAAQGAIADWSRLTYGWMGRTPDYKGSFTNTLGANAEFYGRFADNARAWYGRVQEAVPFINHTRTCPVAGCEKYRSVLRSRLTSPFNARAFCANSHDRWPDGRCSQFHLRQGVTRKAVLAGGAVGLIQ